MFLIPLILVIKLIKELKVRANTDLVLRLKFGIFTAGYPE